MRIKTKCPVCRAINTCNPLRGCRTCGASLIPAGKHGKKEKEDLKRISLLVDPDQLEQLEILSKKFKVNRSAVIRFILKTFIREINK